VDGLSTRALEEVQSALPVSESPSSSESQPQILEMHGRVLDVLCTSEKCGHCETVPSSPICSALSGTEELVESGVIEEPTIDKADLPRCTQCGDLARPGVVWFGEQPHHIPIIDKLVDQATLCLVVGTSSTVSCDPMCSVEARSREDDRCTLQLLISV
jgi:NAD-dependent deacetylase sirtuin 5